MTENHAQRFIRDLHNSLKQMMSSLRRKSAVVWVVNSTTNVHSRIVKRTVHTAGDEVHPRTPGSPFEGCGLL